MQQWTIERETRLTELWEQGLSCQQIADALGGFEHTIDRGRCAVIGKARRMKLPPPEVRKAVSGLNHRYKNSPKSPLNRKMPAPDLRLAKGRKASETVVAARIARAELNAGLVREELKVAEPPLPTHVTLQELDDDGCRWPSGDPSGPDFRYCGCRKLPNQPYCKDHAARAYAGAPTPNISTKRSEHV